MLSNLELDFFIFCSFSRGTGVCSTRCESFLKWNIQTKQGQGPMPLLSPLFLFFIIFLKYYLLR